MGQKFNIRVTHNRKQWLVFCVPVSFEECREASLKLATKYSSLKIV